MALAQEDIEQIEELIRKSIAATPEVGNANVCYEIGMWERTIRIEDELKHQRELILMALTQMEKRLDNINIDLNKHFEQPDK